jgi:hypothetical protein
MRDREATSNGRPGAGTLFLTRLYLPSPATINNISTFFTNVGTQNTTGMYFGLYNASGTLLGTTGDVHTTTNAVAANTIFTLAMTSTVSWAGGTGNNALLFVAYIALGGAITFPNLGGSTTNTVPVDFGFGTGLKQGQQLTGQSGLPTPLTMSSLTAGTTGFWHAVS